MRGRIANIIIQLIALIWMFGAGFWFYGQLHPPTVTPVVSPTPTRLNELVEYDVLIATQSDSPQLIFIEMVVPAQRDAYGYLHYFNGSVWLQRTIDDSHVSITDHALTNASIRYANSIRVDVSIDDALIQLEVPQIYTPMVIRAEEEFTKFGGSVPSTEALITINTVSYPCQVALLKGYHRHYSAIDVYALGVQTHWIMYWDHAGNFYHLDQTAVEQYDPAYLPHEFFAQLNPSSQNTNHGTVAYFANYSVDSDHDTLRITSTDSTFPALTLAQGPALIRSYYADVSTGTITTGADGGIGLYLHLDTTQTPQLP